MADFWENILFFTGNYDGNPMEAHKRINEKQTMVPNEFEIWIKLFCSTVDELFEGKNAEKIKSSSTQIALIMKSKIYTA
jgi:hemoglobin